MARGTTLTALIDMLRKELGTSSNPALSQSERDILVHQLNRAQEFYYDDYAWPHLRVRKDKTLSAGQRYYDAPADIDIERILSVHVEWNDHWYVVEREIDLSHYDILDPEDDARLDPVQRWDIVDVGSGPQIEVWPMPETDGLKLRFEGTKKLSRMVSGDDTCILDDTLIVLTAASKLATRYQLPDAEEPIAAARRRYEILKSQQTRKGPTATPSFATGLGGKTYMRHPHQIVAVHKED